MGSVGAYVFLSDCFTHDCGVPYLKALTHPLRRAWLLCAVEPTLWDPVCKSCALPLSTGYLFGQALASRHPLFFQWVTRERDSKREYYLHWRFDLGLTRCWAAPACESWGSYHGYIEDVWNTFMEAWVVANGQHLLRRRNLVWHCTLAI